MLAGLQFSISAGLQPLTVGRAPPPSGLAFVLDFDTTTGGVLASLVVPALMDR